MDKKGSTYIIRFVIENWWVDYFDACYNQISLKLYIEAIEDSQLLSISYDRF